jgi:hypothetical protein
MQSETVPADAVLEDAWPIPRVEPGVAPSKTRLDAALNRWLAFVKTHPLAVHLLVGVCLTVVADAVLLAMGVKVPAMLEAVVMETAIALAGFLVPLGVTAVTLRREFAAMLHVVADGPPAATPVLLRFVTEELTDLQEQVEDLRAVGAVLEADGISDWVRNRCFAVTSGTYFAADSCVPSVYLNRYRPYLDAHADYLKRTGSRSSVRVNVAPAADLARDLREQPEAFRSYVDWHRDHGVVLLHVDADEAEALAARHALAGVVDWAYWEGELALSWAYELTGVRMRIAFVGELGFRRANRYMRELISAGRPFEQWRAADEAC